MAKEPTTKKLTKRPTAQKRAIQNEKKRLQNRSSKASARTVVRDFIDGLVKGDPSQIQENLSKVYSAMDKGVKKGIFTLNKANRTKARLAARCAV